MKGIYNLKSESFYYVTEIILIKYEVRHCFSAFFLMKKLYECGCIKKEIHIR